MSDKGCVRIRRRRRRPARKRERERRRATIFQSRMTRSLKWTLH